MNTYELEIYLNQKGKHVVFEEPIHHYVECEEHMVESHLVNITTKGFFVDGDSLVYIPGHRIDFINVKFLEKQQIIPNVSESIKAVLKEE